jgi:N-acetylglucosaminyldiphosphoundecaprenol N-acetyl-beta-D-mannosaminyltransferase
MPHADPAGTPARGGSVIAPGRDRDLLELDNYELPEFLSVAARFGNQKYGYVITPNVDHLIRYHDDPAFRALYADAAYVLLDSRFLSHLFRLIRGLRVRVCTGSDLTAQLFARVIAPPDRLVLIGGSAEQAQMLAAQYGLTQLSHYNPPMGFIRDPRAVEECLQFIEAHSPFRFCFLAVGAPQQEVLAQMLKARGIARGMALCIGASVNFMTGVERRAPRWMQRLGAEWLYRLVHNPGRLAKRYLVRGPRVFWLLPLIGIQLRPRVTAPVLAAVTAGIKTQDTIY